MCSSSTRASAGHHASSVIYHCFGGAHSSVVAAALHVGLLDTARVPGVSQLESLRLFDSTTARHHGIFHHFGRDEMGNDVYSVGFRNQAVTIKRALGGLCDLYGIPRDDVLFVDTLDCVNWKLRLGGWMSRAVGQVKAGRPLVVSGIREAFPGLCRKVRGAKKELETRESASVTPSDTPGFRVVYFCYGGTHSSIVCAGYHLGMLPRDRAPRVSELTRLPYFDRVPKGRLGDIRLVGVDVHGTAVYAVGLGPSRDLCMRAVRSFLATVLFATEPRDIAFYDCLALTGPWVKVAGTMSRGLGFRSIGRLGAALALRARWRALAGLAQNAQLAARPGRVT